MKYIFFDIDNTIYSVEENQIRPSVIELFKKLHDKGFKLGVATGRNNTNLEVLAPIEEYLDYYVLSNGMFVRDKFNKVIYKNNISKELFNIVYDIFKSSPEYYLGLGGTSWRFFLNKRPLDIKKELEVGSFDQINFDELETIWLVSLNQELIDEQIEYLRSLNKFNAYKWNKEGTDIVLLNHGKETGVSKILEQNNDCELLISVGDGDNDLRLMQMADFGIAMLTTKSEALINQAKYHISSVDSDELLELFKKLGYII